MKSLPIRFFLLLTLLLVFNSEAVASVMACPNPHGPGSVICELSLEDKIKNSFKRSKLVLLGSFRPIPAPYDSDTFKTFIFEIDKVYKGSIRAKSVKMKMSIYAPLSKVSSESSEDFDEDYIDKYSRSIEQLERRLAEYTIDRRTFREELEKKRIKFMRSPNYSFDIVPIFPVRGFARRADVPVEVGKKYILFLNKGVDIKQPVSVPGAVKMVPRHLTIFPTNLNLYPLEKQGLIESILYTIKNPSPTVAAPAVIPPEVHEYLASFKKLQKQSKRQLIDPLYTLAQLVTGKLLARSIRGNVLESLSADDFEFLMAQMKGFKINRVEEQFLMLPDDAFFLELSKEKGLEVDIAFFNLLDLTGYDGINFYYEKNAESEYCIKFGSGLLVDFYGKWRGFEESFPSAYFNDVRNIRANVRTDLIMKKTCGPPSNIIKELELFIKTYPDSDISGDLERRIKKIQMNKKPVTSVYQEDEK